MARRKGGLADVQFARDDDDDIMITNAFVNGQGTVGDNRKSIPRKIEDYCCDLAWEALPIGSAPY